LNGSLSESEINEFAKTALKDEIRTAAIYGKLSEKLSDRELSNKLSDLSKMESEHADFWKEFLNKRNFDARAKINESFISFLTLIYKLLGIGLTLKILEIGERRAIRHYSYMLRSNIISQDEKEFINKILLDEISHEDEFEEHEDKYKFFVNKIATIFTQMSGGLVIVISVSIGFSGIYNDPFIVGISGLIVGITGALNTVVGFYFFGRTQKQVKRGILERIKIACECAPQAYMQRIIKYMKGKDFNDEIAKEIAEEAKNKNIIDRIIAEEEYGIKEESLGNPLESALYAGLFKIIGTILPLTPYFVGLPVMVSIPISVAITLLLLVIAGSLVAIAAELDVKKKVIELTISGLILSSLTFIIGKLTSILINIVK